MMDIIENSRIRSKKTRKIAKETDLDKQALDIWKKRDEFSIWSPNKFYIDLPKPIQRGYIRTFTLTEEAKRRSDYKTLEKLLEMVNIREYSLYPVFNDFNGKKKARRLGLGIKVVHEFRNLKKWKYEKLSEEEKKYFKINYASLHLDSRYYDYEFTLPKKYYKLSIIPNMIDKIEMVDSEYMSKAEYYYDKSQLLWGRIIKVTGMSNYYSDYRKKSVLRDEREKKSFKNTPLHELLDLSENGAI